MSSPIGHEAIAYFLPLENRRSRPIFRGEEKSSGGECKERRLAWRITRGDVRDAWAVCEIDIVRARLRRTRGEVTFPLRSLGEAPDPERLRGAKSPVKQLVPSHRQKVLKAVKILPCW